MTQLKEQWSPVSQIDDPTQRAVVTGAQIDDSTYKICKILTDILNPIVCKGESYLENSSDLTVHGEEIVDDPEEYPNDHYCNQDTK